MITSLRIQDLAIIDSLEIGLTPGFNVITGETGAGKSILIRALNFLTGTKTSSEAVRKGRETATVTGEFCLPHGHLGITVLSNMGIPFEEEGEEVPVLIRRQINQKGRAQSWVNDTPVTAQALRELGETLLDVFGQHENQKLLNPKWHLGYIDGFLSDRTLKSRYSAEFRSCQETKSALQTLISTFTDSQKNKDYLSFRLEELKAFAPSEQDYVDCLAVSQQSGKSSKVFEALQKITTAFEGEDGGSPSKMLWSLSKLFSDPALREDTLMEGYASRLREIASEIEDIHFELGKKASALDLDPETLENAEKRLYGYQDLFRKHGLKEIKDLIQALNALELQMSGIEKMEEKVGELVKTLARQFSALEALGSELSKQRLKAFKDLKKGVEEELHALSMPGARFDVEWKPVQSSFDGVDLSAFSKTLVEKWQKLASLLSSYSVLGREDAEFLLASNPGEATFPLHKTASGGELSRIMLALKKAIAIDSGTCILVFDEIDSGISGRTADVVGKKIQELASAFQVICISHLPQVAVYADTHFLVEKKGAKGKEVRTESQIVRLSKEDSEKEIARLLSGEGVTASSLANARALIAKAHGTKKGNPSLLQVKNHPKGDGRRSSKSL